MNTETESSFDGCTPMSEAPSAGFIHAISEFLDTNPDDLLVELGYYTREGDVPVVGRPLASTTSPQE